MKPTPRLLLATLALGAAAMAASAGDPEPPLARDEVSAPQLAEWLRARRPGLVIVDARAAEAMQRDRLPGARPLAGFDAAGVDTVVVYGGATGDDAPALPGNPARVLRLRGGIEAWNDEVLFPVLRSDAPERHRREFAARAQLSRYFGGSPRVLDPGAQPARTRSRRGC